MPVTRLINIQFAAEIGLRVLLLAIFIIMDTTMHPFVRTILPSEMESLKHPRHESFVPAQMLWYIVIGVPCAFIICTWLYGQCFKAGELFMAWTLAFTLNAVITDAVKFIVGRPRPDFFYRCYPDGIVSKTLECTGDLQDVMDGRVSFPSGHSSFSFCSLGMVSLWSCGQLKMLSQRGSGIKVVICGIPLFLALVIALSRSCDNHHHWEDILIGSMLGYSISLFCYRQYFNPLTSDLSGVPYLISSTYSSPIDKTDASATERSETGYETTPLIGGRKEDKWI